ncbi:MAG: RNA polymerase subunit sigma-70 [Clostridium sp.]|jgi:endogenous inhibitor of DNA gyrase (YacG/DUF329 family)|nr:RNA polymerase subunit sigma-70 [Clostridium sp.]
MNHSQKERIAAMRGAGATYAYIAQSLGLSANTVKSYCQRNNLGANGAAHDTEKPRCEHCKRLLPNTSRAHRRFCSDACRLAWWHKHPGKLNQKAVYHFVCPVCHKAFTAYGNANRKYCSRKCYGKSKRKATYARKAVAK